MDKVMRLLTIVAAGASMLFGSVTLAQPERSAQDKVAALTSDEARDDAARAAPATAALEPCDTECVQRRREDKLRARIDDEMTRVPAGACSAPYLEMDATSRRLAEDAVEECRRNYVMKKIDPKYVAQTRARDRSTAYNRELTRQGEQAVKALSLLWLTRQQR